MAREAQKSTGESSSYLALGDSYTIGEKVKLENAWPTQWAEELGEKGRPLKPVKIIAKTGWRSDELLEAMKDKLRVGQKYDLVSLSIGVNNQYQGKPTAVFKKDFKTLLNTAIARSKKGKQRVFVVSIPNYGVTPFGQSKNPEKITRELKQYNSICRKICKEMEVSFYNITPISLRAKNDNSLVASDGLHPSVKMYRLWIEHIKGRVFRKLKN